MNSALFITAATLWFLVAYAALFSLGWTS